MQEVESSNLSGPTILPTHRVGFEPGPGSHRNLGFAVAKAMNVAPLRHPDSVSSCPLNSPISTLLERKRSGVHAVSPAITVAEAVADMNDHRIGAVVVVEKGQLVGIFTERDVLKRVVGAGLDPRQALIADVMTKDLVTVLPSVTVEQAMEIFTDRRCRHLPVVENGQLLGLISIGDVTRWSVDLHRTECEHLKNYIVGGLSG